MNRWIPIAIVIGVILVVVIAIDLSSQPKPTKGQCLLAKNIVLPDACVNSCPKPLDCTATTRPYAVFFKQAATCMDAVICSATPRTSVVVVSAGREARGGALK
jgi:hypothetical protein